MTRRLEQVLTAAVLLLLQVGLYRKVVRLFWTFDDPNLLHLTIPVGFAEPFWNGALWPQQLFTPLLMTAFQAEASVYGADDPAKWYASQLVIAWVAALAVYAAARMFLDFPSSLAAAALFTAGAPFCSVITQLSTVHYLLSILLIALSLMAFVTSIRRPGRMAWIASVLLYLGAMLAKEVAIPLPLLLLALPVGDVRTRARRTTAHGIALAAYFAWRRAVIGAFFGAYGWVIAPSEWPELLLKLPWRVAGGAAGTKPWLGYLLIGAIVLVIGYAVMRDRRRLLLLLIAAMVVIAPLLPVAKEVNRRYVLVPWLACAVAFAACAATLPGKSRLTALVLVPLLAISVNRQEWGHEFGLRQRMSDESRTFFELPPGGLLRNPSPPPSTMREISWVKLVYLGKPAGGAWFYDDIFLCTHDMSGRRVWEFDPAHLVVREITAAVPALARNFCGKLHTTAPLSADFHFHNPVLHWEFGPYDDGRYTAVIADGFEVFPVPRRDALNIPGVTSLALRVRYDSPQGWTTYSPEIPMDFAKQSDFHWQR